MRRLFGLVLAGMMVLGVFSAPAGADDSVKVWTQNLYIGADLTPVIAAQTPGEFFAAAQATLEQIAANIFPLRAQRLATEVALYQPDVIALQEVEDISVNGGHPGPPFVDYLESLLDALALRGQNYTVAATVVNLDLTIPIDLDGDGTEEFLRVFDRDVILVRNGVTFNNITLPCTRPSENGCNYIARAVVDTPFGLSIDIERGFVGIEATVHGKKYLFVTTHLEQRVLTPQMPETAFFQSAQAAELAAVLGLLPPGAPLILLGDFNSSPKDVPISLPGLPQIIPPYLIISGNGFTDSWKKNPLALLDPNGYTCCQDGDLANRTSLLYERIDIVFIRNARFTPWEFVTTKVPLIFPEPHWASDHGGVFAKLTFR